jgi:hypothetical protein
MARWIAFDRNTVAELRSQLPNDSVFEAPGRTALDYALNTTRPVVAVLEAAGNQATIAIFRPVSDEARDEAVETPQVEAPIQDSTPIRDATPVRASGFLGLSDDFSGADEEESGDKTRWWQFWR